MTLHVGPKTADDLAASLREETANADDLLRIERGLARELRARRAPARTSGLVSLGSPSARWRRSRSCGSCRRLRPRRRWWRGSTRRTSAR